MKEETRLTIIKALKKGVSLRKISRETGVPVTTISDWTRRDKEMQQALTYYKNIVDNIFCG